MGLSSCTQPKPAETSSDSDTLSDSLSGSFPDSLSATFSDSLSATSLSDDASPQSTRKLPFGDSPQTVATKRTEESPEWRVRIEESPNGSYSNSKDDSDDDYWDQKRKRSPNSNYLEGFDDDVDDVHDMELYMDDY